MYFILLFVSLIPAYLTQDQCVSDSSNYYSCIDNQRKSDRWFYRKPYQDFDGVNRCLTDAGCDSNLDYKRGLFVDFIKIWQNVADKIWKEFTNTPENIKQCIREIIVKYSRSRLDQCLQNVGGIPLGKYPPDIELPYCGQFIQTPADLESMKAGIAAKVDVLHEISVCREAKGEAVAAKAVACIDAIRHNFVVNNYCNETSSCTQNYSASSCNLVKNNLAICQCAKMYRDETIATIDRYYAAGSVNVLKFAPVFLGLDLTVDTNAQMKKCYTDNGAKPISVLNLVDNPFINSPLLSVSPRPQGIQAMRAIAYAQYDLPDLCDSCPN